MNMQLYRSLLPYTLGTEKADLVLKNAEIVLVQTGEILTADLAIVGSIIAGIGSYQGRQEIDCSGQYLVPGFIDSHLHFESTMANPKELVHYASLCGTTTFIADPHEAGNVAGLVGVQYMLDETADCQADVYFMLPSCVPCKADEDSGAVLEYEDLMQMANHPRIRGLGEVMDTRAVLKGEEKMLDKLALFQEKIIDGHALGLANKELAAYAMANIRTDHESSTFEQALAEARNGIYVHIREGSAARNLENIVRGLVEQGIDPTRFTFCTDDKHIEDIQKEGHISHNIRKAIALGLPPLTAYKMATYNAAACYHLKDIGMIAPGFRANLVLLNDLESVAISRVFYHGREIDRSKTFGRHSLPTKDREKLLQTVHIDWFQKEMLAYKSQHHAIGFIPGEILTKKINLPQDRSTAGLQNKVVLIERHHQTGKYHVAPAFGYGLKNGAIASSVSHDSHNIIAIGDNDADLWLAISEMKRLQGGYVLVSEGQVYETLPLPVMGLISDLPNDILEERLKRMIQKAHELGVHPQIEPFISLSFIALPVIPEIRITTNGLYDVLEDRYLD